MTRVVALGEQTAVQGYALAGAMVITAPDDAAVRAAWDTLPDDVAVVVLTPQAARALGPARDDVLYPLVVVMPQ